MDLGNMDLEQLGQYRAQLEQYQAELRRLHVELIDAASAGRFRQAGKAFARIMQLQHDYGQLPSQPELADIRDELAALDKIPSRVLGIL